MPLDLGNAPQYHPVPPRVNNPNSALRKFIEQNPQLHSYYNNLSKEDLVKLAMQNQLRQASIAQKRAETIAPVLSPELRNAMAPFLTRVQKLREGQATVSLQRVAPVARI